MTMASLAEVKTVAAMAAAVMLAGAAFVKDLAAADTAEPRDAAAADQKTILSSSNSYWRIWLTHRRIQMPGEDGKLVERLYRHGTRTALPEAGWALPDFDDKAWVRKHGPFFRFADVWGMAEQIYPGMALLCARGRFEVTDPNNVKDMTVSVGYRGGVVVYLNGKEIARGHVPDPEKKGLEAPAEAYPEEVYRTADGKLLDRLNLPDPNKDPANAEIVKKWERRLNDINIPASLLRKGTNVLAVEVHRSVFPKGWDKMAREDQTPFIPFGLSGVELKAFGEGIEANVGRPKGVHLWAYAPSERLLEKDYCTPNDPGIMVLKVVGAKNGAFPGHAVVSSTEAIKGLKAEVSDLRGPEVIPAKAIQVRYPLAQSRKGLCMKGLWDWNLAGYQTFDMLEETPPAEVPIPEKPNPTQTKDGICQPIWLTVNVPKDARAGEYSGMLTATVEGAPAMTLPIKLNVADWTLPDPKDFQTEVGFHESWETVALQYKVPLWSERHWELLDKIFMYMGMVGQDHVHIYMIAKSHAGNSESMVRWVKNADGSLTPDLSIAARYLDLYLKYCGKPKVICAIPWDIYNGGNNRGLTKAQFPPKITIIDPKTGMTEEGAAPHYGTPEAVPFWKPVYEGLLKMLKDRGLDPATLMHGIAGDTGPNAAVVADLNTVLPGGKWVFQNHAGPWDLWGKNGESIGAAALVYIGSCKDPDDESYRGKRWYGWQQEINPINGRPKNYVLSCFGRFTFPHSCPAERRTLLEQFVAGSPCLGVSRIGFDFWPGVVAGRPYSIASRYDTGLGWGSAGITAGEWSYVSPGKDGPVSTIVFEMLRAGAQESEARIFLEKALVDPAKRSKIGEDLAKRIQTELDARQKLMAIVGGYGRNESYFSFNSWWWEESTGRIYEYAAEAAMKIGS